MCGSFCGLSAVAVAQNADNGSAQTSVQKNANGVTISTENPKQTINNSTLTFYFAEGVKAFLEGDDKGAKEIFEFVVKQANGHAPASFYLSKIALRNRDIITAEVHINKALEIDPENVDYLEELAQMEVDKNNADKALQIYSKLAILDSVSTQYKIFIPILHYIKGDVEKAIELVDQYEKKYGFEDRLYTIKREFLINNQKFEQLEEYTLQALQSDPVNPEKMIHMAQVYASFNKDSLAVEYYKKATESASIAAYVAFADFYKARRNPEGLKEMLEFIFDSNMVLPKFKMDAFFALMQMLKQDKIEEGFLDSLPEKIIAVDAKDKDVTLFYLQYLLYRKQTDKAVKYCESVYNSGSYGADFALVFLQVLYQADRKKEAAKYGYELVKKFPNDSQLGGLVAHLAFLDGDTKKAIEIHNNNIKFADTDSLKSAAYGARGDFYYELKKPAKYYQDYEKALQLDPDNAAVLNNLAYFMTQDGKDLNEALKYAKKANEISPQNPTYLDTQAWVNYKMGRYDEAKRLMQLALALDRNPTFDLLLHYGDIIYALGEDYMAREFWTKALKAGADEKEINKRMALPKAVK